METSLKDKAMLVLISSATILSMNYLYNFLVKKHYKKNVCSDTLSFSSSDVTESSSECEESISDSNSNEMDPIPRAYKKKNKIAYQS